MGEGYRRCRQQQYRFDQVRVFNRRYETHADKWRFAAEETSIATDWILRLDADYQVTDELIAELAHNSNAQGAHYPR